MLFWWIMNLKKIAIFMAFNIVCATGETLAFSGLILACWFFFASQQDGRFCQGAGALVAAFIGYAIYRYIFPKIYNKWTDRY